MSPGFYADASYQRPPGLSLLMGHQFARCSREGMTLSDPAHQGRAAASHNRCVKKRATRQAQSCIVEVGLAFCRSPGLSLSTGAMREKAQAMAHLVEKEFLARANSALLLVLVCGGLAICAFGAAAFDLSRWFAE